MKLTSEQRQALINEAFVLFNAGFALLPIKTDGSKGPSVLWAEIGRGREQPMAIEKIVRLIENGQCDGIGLLMGRASGNAESSELEGRVMDRFEELVEYAASIGVDDLLDKLFTGFVDESPSGGLHFHYRISDSPVGPNTPFARRPNPEDPEKPLVLAETRGQGGYMICAPSGGRTHETGLPYTRVAGGPATMPVFTRQEVDELHRLFKYLDEMPPKAEGDATHGIKAVAAGRLEVSGGRLLPGEDFNTRATWQEILTGWTIATTSIGPGGETRTHWRRPGKTIGSSATTFGEDGPLHVFSTSTKLPANMGLSKFAAYCHLNHGGDFSAAARDLADKGYGSNRGSLFEYKPFPVDALPDPLRGFVAEAAKATSCDASYIALPALTALAAAIGTSRRLVLKGNWKPYPILWTGLIGESGNHKSVGRRIAIGPAAVREAKAQRQLERQQREYEERLAEWERDYAAWKKGKTGSPCPTKPKPPIAQRFVVDNVTIEAIAPLLLESPRGLLLAPDELGGWLGSFDRYTGSGKGKADEAAWLSMYNAEPMRIDRKTGNKKSIYVPRAACCITGGITPGSLKRALGVEHMESGLAARFLWAFPPRQEKTWSDVEVRPEVEAAYAQLFEILYSLQPLAMDDGELIPVDVGLTADARSLFEQLYNQNAKELVELRGHLAALWSKLEETTGRLALVMHFVRWAGGEKGVNVAFVDETSVAIAAVLIDWFKNEAKRVYGTVLNAGAAGRQENEQERLVQFIRNRGGVVSPRDTQQGCRWLRGSGKAESALRALAEQGLGDWQEPDGEDEKGRAGRFVLRESASGENQRGATGQRMTKEMLSLSSEA